MGKAIEKVKSIYTIKNDIDALLATCDMGIPHFINTLQYEKAEELVQILSNRWDFIKQNVNDGKLLLYAYHSFLLYWVLGNEEILDKWAFETINYSRTKKAKGLYFITQILNLTRKYDQQQFFNFIEKIETLKRTVQNNDHLMPFEKIIFKHLKELLNIQNGTKSSKLNRQEKKSLTQSAFKNFKTDLLNLKETQERFIKPTGYEEIMIWIESKIQQKSIKEAFEESVR